MIEEKDEGGVHFGNVQGDVIGGKVSGTGHTFGKNVSVSGRVSVNSTTRIHNEYARSLADFSNKLNDLVEQQNIPQEQVKPIQKNIDELTKEVEDIKPEEEQEIDYVKQTNIESKLASLVQNVVKALPQAAETAATFTPLAPFSKLIGKSIEHIVAAVQRRR
ncbi:MAG: hypothetical protein ACM3X1_05785 [Ignavibacteriales bacterium]